jgi:hypothetical protein
MTISPDWLTASATIGLAFVAFFTIFRDEIRHYIRHPRFSINFTPGPPDCQRVRQDMYATTPQGVTVKVDSAETHYIRARVHVGEVGAENVEVFVVEVRRKDADGAFRRMPIGTPWNLIWAHIGSHVLAQLPVGAERHIDIGHVIDPVKRVSFPGEDKPGSDPSKTLFSLAFFVKSNSLEHLLDPGKEYQVDFRVFASNAPPSSVFTFHLNHIGTWYLDESKMYTEALGLRIARKNG